MLPRAEERSDEARAANTTMRNFGVDPLRDGEVVILRHTDGKDYRYELTVVAVDVDVRQRPKPLRDKG